MPRRMGRAVENVVHVPPQACNVSVEEKNMA
jgi:hypothetical protein